MSLKIFSKSFVKFLIDKAKENNIAIEGGLATLNDYLEGKYTYTQMIWADCITEYIKQNGECPPEMKETFYKEITSGLRKNRWSDDVADHRYWVDTSYTFDNGWETMVFKRKADGTIDYKNLDAARYEEPEDALEGHENMCQKWSLNEYQRNN